MLVKKQPSCNTCHLYGICLPLGLNLEELHQFSDNMPKSKVFSKNSVIFKEKERFHSLYIVRSGCVKICRSGRITGFFISGEILGLDAIYKDFYQDTAVTLGTVSVCKIQFEDLLSITEVTPNLQKQFIRLMSEKIGCNTSDGERNTSAEKRIANFILNLLKRFKRAGLSSTNFILPMRKKDIADYLGIATETMSRALLKLHDKGILLMNKKEFNILNMHKLQEIACEITL